jgi:hydrogenase maturation protein HypF
MVRDLEAARAICHVDRAEAALLSTPEAPIVLLERREDAPLSRHLAPDNPRVGVMLPTTPLHHLIARGFERPLVATSGNLSDEPICIANEEAGDRLGGIADCFLHHDRPIARHVDDSVTWVLDGAPQILRRARGLAPMPILLSRELPDILGVGAHLKNAVALATDDRVFVSQHIGDMETPEALGAFEHVVADFLQLYRATPTAIAHDLHPDYAATRWATDAVAGIGTAPVALRDLPLVAVQHHHAHLTSCLAEHGVDGPALGVIWDGTGLGTDGTIWGGEFLLGDSSGYRRVARFRPFALPGGDSAARDPRRPAIALLHALGGADDATLARLPALRAQLGDEAALLLRMLDRGFNSPLTSSAGRLFDAVAALTGLADRISYEGEAAMRLEFAAADGDGRAYEIDVREVAAPAAADAARCGEAVDDTILELDWAPMVAAIIDDVGAGVTPAQIAAGFHSALLGAIDTVVRRIGARRVALSGGCFQNRRLQVGAMQRLPTHGLEVLVQRQVPPNDGGISLGQVVVAATRMQQAGATGRENG